MDQSATSNVIARDDAPTGRMLHNEEVCSGNGRGTAGARKLITKRKAEWRLECPISHTEHGDTPVPVPTGGSLSGFAATTSGAAPVTGAAEKKPRNLLILVGRVGIEPTTY